MSRYELASIQKTGRVWSDVRGDGGDIAGVALVNFYRAECMEIRVAICSIASGSRGSLSHNRMLDNWPKDEMLIVS